MTTTNTPTRKGPASARLDAEAVALAQQWVEVRKDVRSRLIALARAKHPAEDYQTTFPPGRGVGWRDGWTDISVRKLYQYPSDLSDERLLNLATSK